MKGQNGNFAKIWCNFPRKFPGNSCKRSRFVVKASVFQSVRTLHEWSTLRKRAAVGGSPGCWNNLAAGLRFPQDLPSIIDPHFLANFRYFPPFSPVLDVFRNPCTVSPPAPPPVGNRKKAQKSRLFQKETGGFPEFRRNSGKRRKTPLRRPPCLSLRERWPSAARTERARCALSTCVAGSGIPLSPSQSPCGDSSPKGRAKGVKELNRTPLPLPLGEVAERSEVGEGDQTELIIQKGFPLR